VLNLHPPYQLKLFIFMTPTIEKDVHAASAKILPRHLNSLLNGDASPLLKSGHIARPVTTNASELAVERSAWDQVRVSWGAGGLRLVFGRADQNWMINFVQIPAGGRSYELGVERGAVYAGWGNQ